MGLFPVWTDGKKFTRKVFFNEILPRASVGDMSDESTGNRPALNRFQSRRYL